MSLQKKNVFEGGGGGWRWGASNALLMLPLKLRYGAEPLPFGVSPLVNGSNAEL
jgi:hypothetical protein